MCVRRVFAGDNGYAVSGWGRGGRGCTGVLFYLKALI